MDNQENINIENDDNQDYKNYSKEINNYEPVFPYSMVKTVSSRLLVHPLSLGRGTSCRCPHHSDSILYTGRYKPQCRFPMP